MSADIQLLSRRPSLIHDQRGSGTVEKIMVVALFVFGAAFGVRQLGRSTTTALQCQAGEIAVISTGGNATCRPAVASAPLCNGINCMCFVAGTPVVTAAGPQAIENIQPGTLVLARDEFGDAMDWKPVLRAFVNQTRSLVRLTVALSDRTPDRLQVTPNHPFFTAGRGWVPAGELVPGEDRLVDQLGQPVDLVAADAVAAEVAVYNLDVADYHTYFAGRIGVWAHNQGSRPCSGIDTGNGSDLPSANLDVPVTVVGGGAPTHYASSSSGPAGSSSTPPATHTIPGEQGHPAPFFWRPTSGVLPESGQWMFDRSEYFNIEMPNNVLISTEAPTVLHLLNNPEVKDVLESAWYDTIEDPSSAHEEGGHIYLDTSGRPSFHQVPGTSGSVNLANPPVRPGETLVAHYHTHPPRPGSTMWTERPSDTDHKADYESGVPDIVITEYGIFLSGPPVRTDGLGSGNLYPPPPAVPWPPPYTPSPALPALFQPASWTPPSTTTPSGPAMLGDPGHPVPLVTGGGVPVTDATPVTGGTPVTGAIPAAGGTPVTGATPGAPGVAVVVATPQLIVAPPLPKTKWSKIKNTLTFWKKTNQGATPPLVQSWEPRPPEDEWKRRKCNECRTVYRGAGGSPATAFANGMTAAGNNLDIMRHGLVTSNSGYISTSTSIDEADGFAGNARNGHTYAIRVCGGIQLDYDALMNDAQTLQAAGQLAGRPTAAYWDGLRNEQEVAVVGAIHPTDIISATDGSGRNTRNRRYQNNDAARIARCIGSVNAGNNAP